MDEHLTRIQQLCVAHQRIADKIAAWHRSGHQVTYKLEEHLGWTWDEYAHWLRTNELPEREVSSGAEP